jgi:hypothetical protein
MRQLVAVYVAQGLGGHHKVARLRERIRVAEESTAAGPYRSIAEIREQQRGLAIVPVAQGDADLISSGKSAFLQKCEFEEAAELLLGPVTRILKAIIKACPAPGADAGEGSAGTNRVVDSSVGDQFLELLSIAVQALLHAGRPREAQRLLDLYETGRANLPKSNPKPKGPAASAVSGLDARLRFRLGDAESAYQSLARVSKHQALDSEEAQLAPLMVQVIERLGYPSKCDRLLRRLTTRWKDSAGISAILGHAQMSRRNYATASKCYEDAAVKTDAKAPSVGYSLQLSRGVAILQQAMATVSRWCLCTLKI